MTNAAPSSGTPLYRRVVSYFFPEVEHLIHGNKDEP